MEYAPLSLDLHDMNTSAGTPERRRRRSNDTLQALHHQLAFARSEAGLDALVLVDEAGCLVAGAGAWPTCEMLAAYAPLLAHREVTRSETVLSEMAELAERRGSAFRVHRRDRGLSVRSQQRGDPVARAGQLDGAGRGRLPADPRRRSLIAS